MKSLFVSLAVLRGLATNPGKSLEGTWTYVYSDEDNVRVYARMDEPDSQGWIQFSEGGKLQVRQNAGWCGTPPISYRTYEGSYELTAQGQLTLKHGFWGGIDTSYHKLIDVSADTLRLQFIDREYPKSRR